MEKELKLGMVGLDTSHCQAFADVLNNPNNPYHVPGARIVSAYPGGSELFSLSRNRVGDFTRIMDEEYSVNVHSSIEEMAEGMDGFFLESVDGRQHLEQFRILAEFGKPVFIDKPLACSYADAREIVELAQRKNVTIVSGSSIRFGKGLDSLIGKSDTVHSCETYGPMAILDDFPTFYWYGIHTVDLLYYYMGTGCQIVQVHHTEGMDLMIGTWEDGRVGIVHGGRRGKIDFSCILYTESATLHGIPAAEPPPYALMLEKVVPFFRDGIPPIPLAEFLEVIAFLDAAEQSLFSGGKVVSLEK